MAPPLTRRRESILRAAVKHYIQYARPIGSQTAALTSANLGSPATIRKEMRWLEDEGYLSQPHTSAGRVPTEAGYRYFVDMLMVPGRLKAEELRTIDCCFEQMSGEAEQDLLKTSQLLSDVTHCTAIVLSPGIESASLLSLQLVMLSRHTALLVAVLSSGAVEKRTLEFADNVTQGQLDRACRMLCQELIDSRPLDEHLSVCAGSGAAADSDIAHIAAAGRQGLSELASHPQQHIFVGGTAELAKEFEATDTLPDILATLEQQYIVVTMLRDMVDRGVSVSIGAENQLPPLRQCALVAAPYDAAASPRGGSLAVIGPIRMDYPKAMAAVGAISGQLSHLLGD